MEREKPEKARENVVALYRKAEELRAKGDKTGAFVALNEAYKLGTVS